MPSSVVIIDGQEIIRAGTRMALDLTDDFEVVAEGWDSESANAHIKQFKPDALIFDINLPDGDGLDLVQTCRVHSPHTRSLALAGYKTREWAERALDAGCAGYLDKTVGLDEIAPALRSVLRGRTVVSIPTVAELLEEILSEAPGPEEQVRATNQASITVRESQVLTHIAMGLTNQQTADAMFLSVKTIETYRSRLMKKLGLRGRSELFEYAMAQGLVGPAAELGV